MSSKYWIVAIIAASVGFALGWKLRPDTGGKNSISSEKEFTTTLLDGHKSSSYPANESDLDFFAQLAQPELTVKGTGSIGQIESWARLIRGITPERAPRILAELEPLARHGKLPNDLWQAALVRIGEVAGAEVIDFNPENINKDHFGLDFLVEGWSKTSPAEALKWCAGINSGHFKNQVVRGLYRGLMEDDFEAAAALFFKQPIFQGARETRSEFASTLYRAQGFEQSLQTVLELGKERAAVNGEESAYEDTSALYGMIYNSTKGYPWKDRAEAMLKVADDPAFPQYLWQRTLAHGQWESVSDALDWASERSSNISESLANTIQDAAVNAVLSSRDAFGTQIPEWMSTNKEHPLYDRIAAGFVGAVMSEDPEGAAVWAGTIKDDAMRESMQSLLKRNIPE